MLDFTYENKTKLVFGLDKHKEIGDLIKPYSEKVLLIYGGGSIKKSGLYNEVVDSLKSVNINFCELSGVQANPVLSLVEEGINLCRKENIDLILAVGGGSVIDTAKAIAVGVDYEGNVWDLYLTGKDVEKALPVATILTLPAAGSEGSPDSVITNGDKKIGYTSMKIRPLVSVINPKLFYTLPKNQIANGICDMMSHVMERYFTNTEATDFIDSLCESTLKTMMKNALIVKDDVNNYDAWSQISLAGCIGHNGLLGVGREQDWACHKMEHELSAADYSVPHGAGLAVLTPYWMRYVYKENKDRFLKFVYNVMDILPTDDKEKDILDGISKLQNFFVTMGQPTTLKGLGLEKIDLKLLAQKCTKYDGTNENPVGHFKALTWEDVYKIYSVAK